MDIWKVHGLPNSQTDPDEDHPVPFWRCLIGVYHGCEWDDGMRIFSTHQYFWVGLNWVKQA